MLGTNESRCEKNHKKLPLYKPQMALFFHKIRTTETGIQIHPPVLSYLHEKVQERIVYFRARFGEKWCETALIFMRIILVLIE